MRKLLIPLLACLFLLGMAPATQAATPQAAPAAAPASVSFVIANPTAADLAMVRTAEEVEAAEASATGWLPGGNYYWTSWSVSGVTPILTGNIRYSWSHMWYIKNNWTTNTAAAGLLCGFMPGGTAGKSACGLYVYGVASTIRSKVNTAISHKKCLHVRFGLPPASPFAAAGWWEETCRI